MTTEVVGDLYLIAVLCTSMLHISTYVSILYTYIFMRIVMGSWSLFQHVLGKSKEQVLHIDKHINTLTIGNLEFQIHSPAHLTYNWTAVNTKY